MVALELVKIAALAALVALLSTRFLEPREAAVAGVAVLYLLCVRITKT